MEKLDVIVDRLNSFFSTSKFDSDPTMTKTLPLVYNSVGFDWEKEFEPDFVRRMNGLMIRGADSVNEVFLAVFPSKYTLQKFTTLAQEGDMLFVHHPIPLECGDPEGKKGNGFLPILPASLEKIKERRLSVFSLHAPLITNKKISPADAIVNALKGKVTDWFFEYGYGYAGRMCRITPTAPVDLIRRIKRIFDVPYLEVYGKQKTLITNVGIIAGTLGSRRLMKMAESRGADCYLTGEVMYKLDAPKEADSERDLIEQYLKKTSIMHIGVSHAASEFLVLKRELCPWFIDNFLIRARALPEETWWK